MVRLFLIRHGEPQQAWGGSESDPGLCERGAAQAQRATERLRTEGPLSVLSSPMRRCRETAAPFADLTKACVLVEPNVSEVATPAGIADRRAWLQDNFPWRGANAARHWATIDPATRGWRERLLAAVCAIDSNSAIFTHFIAINTVVGAALNRDETIVCKPDFASITELRLEREILHLMSHGAEMNAGEVG
ncbi:MAG: histidine phosphatase family protein [Terricaulis sp.]